MTLTDPVAGAADSGTSASMAAPQVVRLDLTGRTAVVTGAASGIGRGVAVRLAAAGAEVVVVDLASDALDALAAEIGAAAVPLDLSRPEQVDAFDPRGCAVLVNSAGLQHVAAIEDVPADRFAYIQKVMVEAPFRLVRRVLPEMYRQGWGRVVNISSVHGLVASPYKAAYVAAKHALEGLSKVVALEGAEHGVTSNCVNPAYVRTPLVEGQIADQARAHGLSEDQVVDQVMLAPAAIRRLIEPAEVAEAVAYLCSPAATSITGSSLVMDGGWSAH